MIALLYGAMALLTAVGTMWFVMKWWAKDDLTMSTSDAAGHFFLSLLTGALWPAALGMVLLFVLFRPVIIWIRDTQRRMCA